MVHWRRWVLGGIAAGLSLLLVELLKRGWHAGDPGAIVAASTALAALVTWTIVISTGNREAPQ